MQHLLKMVHVCSRYVYVYIKAYQTPTGCAAAIRKRFSNPSSSIITGEKLPSRKRCKTQNG